jgi:hypothetical protein
MASQIFVDAGIDPLGSLDGSIRQAKNGRPGRLDPAATDRAR